MQEDLRNSDERLKILEQQLLIGKKNIIILILFMNQRRKDFKVRKIEPEMH